MEPQAEYDYHKKRGDLFNPDMLIIAVHIREYTLREVAEGTGDKLIYKIAGGLVQPEYETVFTLSNFLDFPLGFFYREGKRKAVFWCQR